MPELTPVSRGHRRPLDADTLIQALDKCVIFQPFQAYEGQNHTLRQQQFTVARPNIIKDDVAYLKIGDVHLEELNRATALARPRGRQHRFRGIEHALPVTSGATTQRRHGFFNRDTARAGFVQIGQDF
ncbi:MAG: hypothetical protein M5R36_20090 [Deltaproteobacteria bacterium]|nr:hypothetical protein [Deltaproteobacteria bacterium]